MRLVTTSPVEGVGAGESVTVTKERGAWLIANGYATDLDDDSDHADDTDVAQEDLPTYGENLSEKDEAKAASKAEKADNAPETKPASEVDIVAPVDPPASSDEAPPRNDAKQDLQEAYQAKADGQTDQTSVQQVRGDEKPADDE